jgi:hypothetical protein
MGVDVCVRVCVCVCNVCHASRHIWLDNGKEGEAFAADSARTREELSFKKWAARVDKYVSTLESGLLGINCSISNMLQPTSTPSPGGCSGQRACQHAQLGIPETGSQADSGTPPAPLTHSLTRPAGYTGDGLTGRLWNTTSCASRQLHSLTHTPSWVYRRRAHGPTLEHHQLCLTAAPLTHTPSWVYRRRAHGPTLEHHQLCLTAAPLTHRYLHTLAALFWPELIIVGGGVSKKADKWLPLLTLRSTQVVSAEMRNEAGIVGAAASVGASVRPLAASAAAA